MNFLTAFTGGTFDLFDGFVWQTELVYLIRVLFAGLLGFIIGVERSHRQKEAGMGTHFTVGLASALFTCISIKIGEIADGDGARVAAQVVTGIGFLGAGIIFFRRESLHGLTTAAIIWATSAIGMACGAGMYIVALGSTALIIVMQFILHSKPFKRHGQRLLLVRFYHSNELQKTLQLYFGITQFHRYKVEKSNDGRLQIEAVIRPSQNYHAEKINNFIENNDAMISIERLEDL
ncbi:MAG: MgtC/SapB family protein [Clostridia bacterium]|nr:MgtC/SapB family protein [Clostridia bacterium]